MLCKSLKHCFSVEDIDVNSGYLIFFFFTSVFQDSAKQSSSQYCKTQEQPTKSMEESEFPH